MKFFMKDFFSKRDQIRSFLRIWSHLLKKSLMENFIFLAVIFSTLHITEWGRNITFMIKNDIIFIMHDVLAVLIYCKL